MAEFDSNYYEKKYLKYKKKYLELVGGKLDETIWQYKIEGDNVWKDIDIIEGNIIDEEVKSLVKKFRRNQEILEREKYEESQEKKIYESTNAKEEYKIIKRRVDQKVEQYQSNEDGRLEEQLNIEIPKKILELCKYCKEYRRIMIMEKIQFQETN